MKIKRNLLKSFSFISLLFVSVSAYADTDTYTDDDANYSNKSIRYAAHEFDAQDIQFKNRLSYESEYVYRGALKGRNAIINDLQATYEFDEADVYTGILTAFPNGTDNRYANEVSPYLGTTYKIDDKFNIDGGYTYYRYTRSTFFHSRKQSHEVFLGASADILLSPAFYMYYDFELKQIIFEGSVGYSLDLAEHLNIHGLSLETRAQAGVLRAKRFSDRVRKNGYNYLGIHSDLVYALNERTKARMGARLAFNTDRKAGPANVFGQHTSTFGWGASLDVNF